MGFWDKNESHNFGKKIKSCTDLKKRKEKKRKSEFVV